VATAIEPDEITFSPESYRLEIPTLDSYRAANCAVRFSGCYLRIEERELEAGGRLVGLVCLASDGVLFCGSPAANAEHLASEGRARCSAPNFPSGAPLRFRRSVRGAPRDCWRVRAALRRRSARPLALADDGPPGDTRDTDRRHRFDSLGAQGSMKPGTWARSLLSPRGRFLPGLGARLATHPRLAVSVLVTLRRLPRGRVRTAVYRNVGRPLVTRMGSLEVPVSGGSRMLVDPSDLIGRVLAISGVWEPDVTAVFYELLSPGDVCVDVGANAGYFTLLASRLVGREGHVYALEPAPESYAALRRHIELNAVDNVTALPFAAGRDEGRGLLHEASPGNAGSASMLPPPDSSLRGTPSTTMEVPVRPVSSLVSAVDRTRVALVKIDVEGFELEVLRGLQPLLDDGLRPAIIVELNASRRAENAASFLVGFCESYALVAFRLPDTRLFGEPAHRLYEPLDLNSIFNERHEVLLVSADRRPSRFDAG
jgi:FkbM family methyltransferase